MNIKDREELMKERFAKCLEVARVKGADYSGKEDALANFKRNGERLGLTKYQIWAVYCAKHIDSVFNSIKADPEHPQVESEPLEERIGDIIVYMVILEALMKEDEQTN